MISSQGESANTVLISNPSPFMTQAYLLKILSKHKFMNASITVNTINQIPSEIYITFTNGSDADKFINQFNGKSFESTLNVYDIYL